MTGVPGEAVVLQAASVCLRYPDESVFDALPLVSAAVEALPAGASRERLAGFLAWVAAMAPGELARHYVEVFDLRRRCCLYLTWWTDGETRRRGGSLAALKARYRAAGARFDDAELPDFLPAILEFAATVDLADGLALLAEHRPALERLHDALLTARTPYAAPVDAVRALLGPPPARGVAGQKSEPPPPELVGLELSPYPLPPLAPQPPAPKPTAHPKQTDRRSISRTTAATTGTDLGMPGVRT
ncbi:nitrate reductase molybdenum cofactor assembly chaperone [Pseudonocardia acaciae]|uniref:nitrate reductase molybdenum cofactor assembly chaperone n=1 Tax=Pseudonocardia acaciae TaxID=551276 RepID=UPI0007E8C2B6|nr:nitrate reductase molybdenum cofactor assembly chaperone [Pseudonocardia acaciae]